MRDGVMAGAAEEDSINLPVSEEVRAALQTFRA